MEECFAIKRNGVLIYTICNMNKLSNHYTKWKKTQKATYFMISSIRNVQNTQIHRDRKEIESWTGSEQEGVVTGTDY